MSVVCLEASRLRLRGRRGAVGGHAAAGVAKVWQGCGKCVGQRCWAKVWVKGVAKVWQRCGK
eukprot:8388910-Alexandrium_andersonii.AAC.1